MFRYNTTRRSKRVSKYRSILEYRHWEGIVEGFKEADDFNIDVQFLTQLQSSSVPYTKSLLYENQD